MKKSKILPLITFITLILLMAYLPSIPIKLLNINIDNFTKKTIILYTFICDLVYMLIIFLIYKKDIIKNFKDFKNNFLKIFELSFKYYLVGLFLMITSNLIISLIFSSANANNEEIIREYIDLYPLYMLFSVSIHAPFVEEMIFRKAIHDCFKPFKESNFNKYFYILLSGFIFAGLHVVGLSDNLIDYIYIIPYLSLGIAFASLYQKSNNIFSTIMMHCLHNTVTVLLYLLVGGR